MGSTDEQLKTVPETKNVDFTLGEKLVRLDFNPGGNPSVNMIKSIIAQAIDAIDTARSSGADSRCAEKAIDALEEAAMWGVKSVTAK